MSKWRLTGVSCPYFGISWEKCNSDIDYIESLFYFLYSKRILFDSYEKEYPEFCVPSIILIKENLVSLLQESKLNSENKRVVLDMIDVCNDALNTFEYRRQRIRPDMCLADALLEYNLMPMHFAIPRFRKEMFECIEKLEAINNIIFPDKSRTIYEIKKENEPWIELVMIYNSRYDPETELLLKTLIQQDALIKFLELYKPLDLHNILSTFQKESRILILDYIRDNYKMASHNKMMKKYDYFAFEAAQIIRDDQDPETVQSAKAIFDECIKQEPSSEELLKFDIIAEYRKRK